MVLENCRKIGRALEMHGGGNMARRERPLDPEGSPTEALAYWLRVLRDEAGMTVGQLKHQIRFSSSTLYSAFGGTQLPTRDVTLAIVRACNGDAEAWHAYWSRMRRFTAGNSADDMDTSLAPPWAARQTQPQGTASHHGRLNAVPSEAGTGAPGRGGTDQTAPGLADPGVETRRLLRLRRRQLRNLLLATSGSALLIVTASILTMLLDSDRTIAPSRSHKTLALVVVQNKVAIGPSSLLEDTTPSYLSSRPFPRCRLQGCEVKGTDMWSGAVLAVTCWVRGTEMTNENTTTTGIIHNRNGVASTLWYRGVWPNGRTGYLSEVYIEAGYRGGLGLPRCKT